MIKQHIQTAFKLLLASLLIGWLVRGGKLDFGALLDLLQPSILGLLLLLLLTMLANNNFRWLLLLRGLGLHSTFGITMRLTLIGIFFNFAMPGGVGGDIVKGYYLIQGHPENRTKAATSILVDRIIGMFAMSLLALFAMCWQWEHVFQSLPLKGVFTSVVIVNLIILIFFLLALSKTINEGALTTSVLLRVPGGKLIRKVLDAFYSFRNCIGTLFVGLFLSFGSQFLHVLFFYIVSQALGFTDIDISAFFYAVPLGLIAMALPVAPGGVGVGQAAFLMLFNWGMGFESDLGPNSVTALQAMNLFWGLFGAYFYFRMKKEIPLKVPT